MVETRKKGSNILGRIGRPIAILIAIAAVLFARFQIFSDREKLLAVLAVADFVNSFVDSTKFNTEKNPFLANNYAPVAEENIDAATDIIEGKIPKDLSGLFLRIGPNQIPGHFTRRYHLFDGHGMLHAIRVTPSGEIKYTNQFLRTPRYILEKELNRSVFLLLGELTGIVGLLKIIFIHPFINRFTKLSTLYLGTANTAIIQHNSKLFALHEGALPFQIKWNDANHSIESLGYESLNNQLNYAVTAHGKVDPVDGGWYFNGYDIMKEKGSLKHGYITSDSKLASYYEMEIPVKSFTHDFLITEHYCLHFESSIIFSPEGIVAGEMFNFASDHKLRVGVAPKNSSSPSQVLWFEAPSSYALVHALNAWEEVDPVTGALEVVLWAPLDDSFGGGWQKSSRFRMHELRLNLGTGKTTVIVIDENLLVEFPRWHPQLTGRKAPFGFGTKFQIDYNKGWGWDLNGCAKFDILNRSVVGVVSVPEGYSNGECVVIPKQTGKELRMDEIKSDAVYLGTLAHKNGEKVSEWFVFDGETMAEKPVLRVRLPARVPYGFHGEWVSETDLQLMQ